MGDETEKKVSATGSLTIHTDSDKKEERTTGQPAAAITGSIDAYEEKEDEKKRFVFDDTVEIKPGTIIIPKGPDSLYTLQLSKQELKQLEKEQKKREKEAEKEKKRIPIYKEKKVVKAYGADKVATRTKTGEFYSRLSHMENFSEYAGDKEIEKYIDCVSAFEQMYIRADMPFMKKNPQQFLEDFLSMRKDLYDSLCAMEGSMSETLEYLKGKTDDRYEELVAFIRAETINVADIRKRIIVLQDRIFAMSRDDTDSIPYGKSIAEVLDDDSMAVCRKEGDLLELKPAGAGGMNSVMKAKDPVTQRTVFLKRGESMVSMGGVVSEQDINRDNTRKKIFGALFGRSFDEGKHHIKVDTAYRDVAVSMVDRLLGLNAVVTTTLAEGENGEQCSLMEMAKGKDASRLMGYAGEEWKRVTRMTQQLKEYGDALKSGSGATFDMKMLQEGKEGAQHGIIDITGDVAIESAMNMAVLDIIVGHIDRHRGNFFIDETGKITGIDNDTSFRTTTKVFESTECLVPTEEDKKAALKKNKRLNMGAFVRSYRAQRLRDELRNDEATVDRNNPITYQNDQPAVLFLDKAFPFVTKELKDKVDSLSLEALRASLEGMLDEEAISACIERTQTLKRYFANLPEDKVYDSIADVVEKERLDYVMPQGFETEELHYLEFNYLTPFLNKRLMGCSFAFEEKDKDPKQILKKENATLFTTIVSRYYSFENYIHDEVGVATELGMLLLKRFEEDEQADIIEMIESGEMKEMVDAAIAKAGELLKPYHSIA